MIDNLYRIIVQIWHKDFEITNSNEERHLIRDLIFNINIGVCYNNDNTLNLRCNEVFNKIELHKQELNMQRVIYTHTVMSEVMKFVLGDTDLVI